jgi:hypothetical protein
MEKRVQGAGCEVLVKTLFPNTLHPAPKTFSRSMFIIHHRGGRCQNCRRGARFVVA